MSARVLAAHLLEQSHRSVSASPARARFEADFQSERSAKLPLGIFKWFKPFWRLPDTYVLDHISLDGFLFLRFLKILIVISFVGCCLTWPILLPLHATGGGGNSELDLLTFGNVANPTRYYAHAVLAWVYFGMFSIPCQDEADSGRFHPVHGGA
jgi:hypothetical protein